jgi:hypothetical protein
MSKYKLEVQWSGYCRGYTTVEVEADSPEEALEKVDCGQYDNEEEVIVRDDREHGEWEIV